VDPVSRRELWALLHEFVHDGMTVLISTPYMDEAERCHRVALLHRGRLLLAGEPNALLADFSREHSGESAVFETLFLARLEQADREHGAHA
jgi:ABC-2 type transport system ATP-binding protein